MEGGADSMHKYVYIINQRGHLVRTHLGRWVGSSLLYISIAYYMQKWGGWVQIACNMNYWQKINRNKG